MANPRVPSNVLKPTGGETGDKRVIDQNRKLNEKARKRSAKLKKQHQGAGAKVRTG